VHHAKSCLAVLIVTRRDAQLAKPGSSFRMESVQNADPVSTHVLSVISMDVTCVLRAFTSMETVNVLIVGSFSMGAWIVTPKSALVARKSISFKMISVNFAANRLTTVIHVRTPIHARVVQGRRFSFRIKSVPHAVCLTPSVRPVMVETIV
jgi:hypothetical protein